MNFYLDIDFLGERSDEQIAEREMFLVKAETFCEDRKFEKFVKAFTGRGYHLLFAIPPTSVKEHPDIKARLGQFRQTFQKAFAGDLSRLELKLDNTMDLSRVAKIYGTKKPGGRRVSRFFGGVRKEDGSLRAFPFREERTTGSPGYIWPPLPNRSGNGDAGDPFFPAPGWSV